MIVVKQKILDQLKKSKEAKGRLAYEFAKTTKTINEWIDNNDLMLTTAMGVRAISEELKIKESEILTEK